MKFETRCCGIIKCTAQNCQHQKHYCWRTPEQLQELKNIWKCEEHLEHPNP